LITQFQGGCPKGCKSAFLGASFLFFRLARKSAFFYAAAWLPAQGMRGAVGARSCGRERQNPLFSAVEGMPLIDKNGTFCL